MAQAVHMIELQGRTRLASNGAKARRVLWQPWRAHMRSNIAVLRPCIKCFNTAQGPLGLADDHAKARQLAAALAAIPGVLLDAARVQSNIVVFGLAPGRPAPAELCARLKRRGVLASPFRGGVRFVTHRDVGAAACRAAADAVAACLAEEEGPGEAPKQANGGAYGQGPAWPG